MQSFHRVIGLYADTRDMQIRAEKETKKEVSQMADGRIRVPAGDNWF